MPQDVLQASSEHTGVDDGDDMVHENDTKASPESLTLPVPGRVYIPSKGSIPPEVCD